MESQHGKRPYIAYIVNVNNGFRTEHQNLHPNETTCTRNQMCDRRVEFSSKNPSKSKEFSKNRDSFDDPPEPMIARHFVQWVVLFSSL